MKGGEDPKLQEVPNRRRESNNLGAFSPPRSQAFCACGESGGVKEDVQRDSEQVLKGVRPFDSSVLQLPDEGEGLEIKERFPSVRVSTINTSSFLTDRASVTIAQSYTETG